VHRIIRPLNPVHLFWVYGNFCRFDELFRPRRAVGGRSVRPTL